MGKVVLAYSGGLDTSVAIRWIKEKYDLDVVTLTVDVGANDRDLESIRARALQIGAVKALVRDVKDEFVKYFIWPALQAGARGVQLFFMLSAFTLFASSKVRFARDRFPALNFYVRRAFRILPLWWAAVAYCAHVTGRSGWPSCQIFAP